MVVVSWWRYLSCGCGLMVAVVELWLWSHGGGS